MRQWNKVCISQLNQVKPEWVYITINYVYLNCIGGQSSPWHLFFIIIFCLRNDSIVKIKGLIFKKSMLPQYHSCNRSHLLLVPDRCGTEAHLTVLNCYYYHYCFHIQTPELSSGVQLPPWFTSGHQLHGSVTVHSGAPREILNNTQIKC